jgi:hypothetical protein
MNIQKLYKWFVVLAVFLGSAHANDGVTLSLQDADEFGNNLLISKEININDINKSFKKKLSNHLNKRECEKKIFVKKANLQIKEQKLVVDFTTRITRQYCTRRAKKRLYEKTKKIQYSYAFDLANAKFVFVETGNEKKQATFNHSLKDVIGRNAKTVMAEILLEELGLNTQTIAQSLALNEDIKFQSAKFEARKLIFKLTTHISKQQQERLFN